MPRSLLDDIQLVCIEQHHRFIRGPHTDLHLDCVFLSCRVSVRISYPALIHATHSPFIPLTFISWMRSQRHVMPRYANDITDVYPVS